MGEIFGAVGKAKAFPGSELYQNISVGAGESLLLIKCLHPQEWAGCAGTMPQNEALPKPSWDTGGGKSFVLQVCIPGVIGSGKGLRWALFHGSPAHSATLSHGQMAFQELRGAPPPALVSLTAGSSLAEHTPGKPRKRRECRALSVVGQWGKRRPAAGLQSEEIAA